MYHCMWFTMHVVNHAWSSQDSPRFSKIPQDSPRFPKIPLSDLYAEPPGGPGPPGPPCFLFLFSPSPPPPSDRRARHTSRDQKRTAPSVRGYERTVGRTRPCVWLHGRIACCALLFCLWGSSTTQAQPFQPPSKEFASFIKSLGK